MPKSSRQSESPANWPIPLLVVGVLLLLLAPWVANLIPTSAVWSDEDARQYTRASAELHAASHGAGQHNHAHATGEHHDRATAQAAFDAIQARRDRAGRWPVLVKRLLQATGIAVCGIGVWGYLRGRRS